MKKKREICDCNGIPVSVGSKVRVLSVPDWLLKQVPRNETGNLQNAVSNVFEITEIDEWGGAWVEISWLGYDQEICHQSLSLDANEMEVVEVNTPSGTYRDRDPHR